jgi:hypothetical protein
VSLSWILTFLEPKIVGKTDGFDNGDIDDASLDCTGTETDWPRLVDASHMIIPIREGFPPKGEPTL